jgi:hypothetical protein
MEIEVLLAMMKDSISGGLGKRMKLQETQVSLRATAPDPFVLTSTGPETALMQVPLTVGGVTNSRFPDPDFAGGNHANGIEIEGNYAKIVTPGLYTITGSVSFTSINGNHSFDFFGSVNNSIFGLPDYGVTSTLSFVGGRVADTRVLAKGDMISLTVGVGTDHVGSIRVQDALLTIAMHYALPTEAIPGL